MEKNNKVLIVSNRLPIKIVGENGKLSYTNSEGGLATGLGSIYKQNDNVWIGWPGAYIDAEYREQVINDLGERKLFPVFLSENEINDFYEGFSNETLWPLFHYFPSYAKFNPKCWDSYIKVNQKFADIILSKASSGDTVWIHDYQLLLVPEMVKKEMPEISIGFFQHIPFPSYEIFRLLPWRKQLLSGILGADVIGFHTYDDVRHFLSAVSRILHIEGDGNTLIVNSRKVVIDAFPMSIDYKKYKMLAEDVATRRYERRLKQLVDGNKLIISIDRLDYSKGIIHRLQAFQLLLERHPELHSKINMLQLIVPSRDTVKRYSELKEEMNRLVSEINGRFGTLGWLPIRHFYRSFPLHHLSALYKAADVALVTPMRDGMNLVSKEYIASKLNQKGVLVLSEMAGASRELSEALIVNPHDIWDFADKIYLALNMPENEQKRRMNIMQQLVSKFDIYAWVKNFMDKLKEVKTEQETLLTRAMNDDIKDKVTIRYFHSSRRLILLDYDGTLVPFYKQVDAAIPDPALLTLLTTLCNDENNFVVITSGRDYKTLDSWLGHLPLDLIAEHGAWYREKGKTWHKKNDLNNDWRPDIYNVLDLYTRRTPGSFIEEKSFSLAWHYRNVETGLGSSRSKDMVADLKYIVADKGLQILQGDKVVEIKSLAINKGKAAKRWLAKREYDFIMAIGDDNTDEDTFRIMPDDAVTIKVGSKISAATYFLSSHIDVRAFLQLLCNTTDGNEEYASDLVHQED